MTLPCKENKLIFLFSKDFIFVVFLKHKDIPVFDNGDANS